MACCPSYRLWIAVCREPDTAAPVGERDERIFAWEGRERIQSSILGSPVARVPIVRTSMEAESLGVPVTPASWAVGPGQPFSRRISSSPMITRCLYVLDCAGRKCQTIDAIAPGPPQSLLSAQRPASAPTRRAPTVRMDGPSSSFLPFWRVPPPLRLHYLGRTSHSSNLSYRGALSPRSHDHTSPPRVFPCGQNPTVSEAYSVCSGTSSESPELFARFPGNQCGNGVWDLLEVWSESNHHQPNPKGSAGRTGGG